MGPTLIPITQTLDIVPDAEVEEITFRSLQLTEAKIEEFLRKNIRLLFDDDEDDDEGDETLLIVGQQVVNRQGGRNDLVALDGNGNLVLIEIKRDATDNAARTEAMEFQAVRYAASLATIKTVDDLVKKVFARYINNRRDEFKLDDSKLTPEELGARLVEKFLAANEAAKSFNRRQRIILVSSTFDEQTLSGAAWMSANGIDISCISLNPIRLMGQGNGPLQHLLAAEKLIPAKKLEDFFVELRDPSTGVGDTLIRTEAKRAKTSLPRMPKLMEWGIISRDMPLKLKGFDESEATVKDAKTVEFKGKPMKFNEWGRCVTGWSAICIYDWAVTPAGKTLSELRRHRMEEIARNQDIGQMGTSDSGQ
jgi:hypothetical protein